MNDSTTPSSLFHLFAKEGTCICCGKENTPCMEIVGSANPQAVLCHACTRQINFWKEMNPKHMNHEGDRLLTLPRREYVSCGHCGCSILTDQPPHNQPLICGDCVDELRKLRQEKIHAQQN